MLTLENVSVSYDGKPAVVDVSIDQGGSVETSHMTTHSDPTYVIHDVVHGTPLFLGRVDDPRA